MLRELIIKNYAIIDHIHLKLSEGLNIITGETGAGKSIIMGALGLTLGNRADTAVLKNNEGKCIVEAVFSVKNNAEAISFIKNNELDLDDNTIIIRREINVLGKSRSFINDTPVILSDLRALTSLLIDQHQQFDNLLVGSSSFQQKIIDTLAKNTELLKEYQILYNQWNLAKEELNKLSKQKETFHKELDFLQFQYKELEEINLKDNELEELDNELKLIESSADVKNILSKIYFQLYEEENSLINTIRTLSNEINRFLITKDIEKIADRLKSAEIELKDIALETETINDSLNFDADRLDIVNDRLSTGYKLLKKHNVTATNELIALKKDLELRLQEVLHIDDEIEEIKEKEVVLQQKCYHIAEEISKRRMSQISIIEENVNKLLTKVGMPNARLKVSIVKDNKLKINGIDNLSFLFDANKTGNFEAVERVASGGELSRLMLCLKSLVAKFVSLPTLIFDEIDTGISGEAAKQVGIIMKDLSDYLQVISITHQPQIAALAKAHYFVYKKENEKQDITTQIRRLNEEEKIEQIAKMLGGEKPSAATIHTAKEMLEINNA